MSICCTMAQNQYLFPGNHTTLPTCTVCLNVDQICLVYVIKLCLTNEEVLGLKKINQSINYINMFM